MPKPEWRRVRALFEEACELAPDERDRFVDRVCGADGEMRAELEALLAADAERTRVVPIEQALRHAPTSGVASGDARGLLIGRYEVKRVLGSGGMSTVFEAAQQNPERMVAVKTMRFGLLSDVARRRFVNESEVLARLRHPAIAQVYEAGTWLEPVSGEELPFFAMELVEGAKPIDRHVADAGLGLPEAIDLFVRVCDGVEHGHRLGFIHRDLKPANILIDARGCPKIIDFGIARATREETRGPTLTLVGQVLGTPQYMAPEQFDPEPGQVDTRADVYALGAVLYELLAGQPAFDARAVSLTELVRRIRTTQPPPPSTCGGRLAPGGSARELDWVIAAAMAPDRSERYGSVSELSADLRRFLAKQPLSVGPPTAVYRAVKFVRRHALAVSAAATVLVALLGGVAGTTWQMLRAESAALAAQRQASKAQNVARLLDIVLDHGNPLDGRIERRGADVTVRAALESVAAKLDRGELTEIADEPDVESTVRLTIGEALYSYGNPELARHHLTRALELRNDVYGEDSVEAADVLNMIALIEDQDGRPEESLRLHRGVVETYRAALGDSHEKTAQGRLNLGASLRQLGFYDEAAREVEAAIAVYRQVGGDQRRFVAIGLHELGTIAARLGDGDRAIGTLREALAAYDDADKGWHPYAASARTALAELLFERGELDEAWRLATEALTIHENAFGERSEQAANVHVGLAKYAASRGMSDQVLHHARAAASVFEETLGPGHLRTVHERVRIAATLVAERQFTEAARVSRSSREAAAAPLGEAHPLVVTLLAWEGVALANLRRLDEAGQVLSEAVSRGRRAGLAAAEVLTNTMLLARVLGSQQRAAEAEDVLAGALEEYEPVLGLSHALVRQAGGLLIGILEQQGKLDRAAALRARFAASPAGELDR